MSEKTYKPHEAARVLLGECQEILKKHEHIGWDKLHGKLEREGYSKDSADKIAGSIKAKVQKSDEADMSDVNTIAKSDKKNGVAGAAGTNELPPVDPMKLNESSNPKAPQGETTGDAQAPVADSQAEANVADSNPKGHIKLAKFMGRMEQKYGKKLDK